MRRKRLRAALLIVVAAALGGIGYLVSHNVSTHKARTLADLGKDFLPEVAQRIQNFHRVKVENGRMAWEIVARDARFFEHENQIVVIEPKVTFYLKEDGRAAHLTGEQGRITLSGQEVQAITIHGTVTLLLDDLEMHTEEATYDRARDLITAPGTVTLHGKTLDVRGQGMEVDVGPQHVRLLRDVETTVHGDAATS